MRRKDAISVRVRAPARGLVTRLPSESADLLRPGDLKRAATVAKNVRYEDGVICNVPGYSKIKVLTALNDACVSHWRMDEAGGTRYDSQGSNHLSEKNNFLFSLVPVPPEIRSVSGKLNKAVELPASTAPYLLNNWYVALVSPTSINSTLAGTWTLTFWVKVPSVLLSQNLIAVAGAVISRSTNTISFGGASAAGLVADTWAFAVVSYDSVAHTVSVSLNNGTPGTASYTKPAANPNAAWTAYSTYPALAVGSYDVVAYDLDSVTLFNRALTGDEITLLYSSGNGLDYPFLAGAFSLLFQGTLLNSATPNPLIGASGGSLYSLERSYSSGVYAVTPTALFTGNSPNVGYPWSVQSFYDKVIFAQHDNDAQFWLPPLPAVARPLPGLPTTDAKWDGVESFFGHLLLWKDDRLKWSARDDYACWIPVAQTATSAIMTIQTSFTQPAVGSTVVVTVNEDPTVLGIVVGQYIRLTDVRSGVEYENYYEVTATSSTTVTLKLQDLTGRTASALTIASSQLLYTVDANEAGETRVVGAVGNGKIFRVLSTGDYAYIFKERSIHSIQYTGAGSGTFFIHPEVLEEGLLSPTCVLNLGDGRLIFLGHRELYDYRGGSSPTPVCQQCTRQLIAELDRARLDKIRMHHNETRHEVWVQYPVQGGFRVLIWNYIEDTASLDDYDSALRGLSAAGVADWSTDPNWVTYAGGLNWSQLDSADTWASLAASGKDRATLLAAGSGELLLWGTAFNRNGLGYECVSETQDYDCDEPDIFKYVDVVVLGLQVRAPTDQARRLYVQVGARDSLDQDIRWTSELSVSVAGNAPTPVKINPGGAGKYLRLRFTSRDADVEWRVSSFEIHCRPGGFF